jgi:2-polyprenyl-3-methyl-5-hydroxy-6-metoxy-1,4-benzoquinol methylase
MDAEKLADRNAQYWDADEIGEGGERVSHLVQDHVYYGHLSIYHFAAPFCRGARVLDAGSGAGYGAAYLAERGARHVLGIDASDKAVAFSRYHFPRPNLDFHCLDLAQITSLLPRRFDFIYSSNTLEHVPDPQRVLRGFWQLLDPEGTLLLAVPPITDDRLLYLNLVNPHHLNLWSPRQWAASLGAFFAQVTPYLHGVGRIGQDEDEYRATGAELTADDFAIEAGTVDEMYQKFTLTAIWLARGPREVEQVPAEGTPVTFVDDSFTRARGYISPRLRWRLRDHFQRE